MPTIPVRRILTAAGLVLFGIALAAMPVVWAVKSGHLRIWEHPAPPRLTEPQGHGISTGAVTSLYPLNFEKIALPYEDDNGRGGAMFTSDRATFHMSRSGNVFEIRPDGVFKLAIDPPFDITALKQQTQRVFEEWFLGVGSAQLVQTPEASNLFVSYLSANADKQCMQIVVARQTFPGAQFTGANGEGWKEIFASDSCTVAGKTVRPSSASHSILVRGSKLYVSHGVIGQDLDAARRALEAGNADAAEHASGELHEVDLETGESRLFANGFRNISGISPANGDALWTVEHGERGGDELNRVMYGEEYGWPLSTFGTIYTGFDWLGPTPAGGHELYTKPVFAWVPSIAPSGIRRIEGGQFPKWQGDLMVSTLKAARLYRIHLDGDVVKYVEPILIGGRIRDFVEGHDGALYVQMDRERLIVKVTPGKIEEGNEGVAALNLCSSCHQMRPGDAGAYSGPSLVGAMGRKIASVPGYTYSAALAEVDGVWTKESLHMFLENPNVFGGGSTMPMLDLSFSHRNAVIKAMLEIDAK